MKKFQFFAERFVRVAKWAINQNVKISYGICIWKVGFNDHTQGEIPLMEM